MKGDSLIGLREVIVIVHVDVDVIVDIERAFKVFLFKYIVFRSLIRNIETMSRSHYRSEMKENLCFSLHFAHLFVTLRLCLEVTTVRK